MSVAVLAARAGKVAGLKVGASGTFENAFEVSQRQKRLE